MDKNMIGLARESFAFMIHYKTGMKLQLVCDGVGGKETAPFPKPVNVLQ